MEVYATTVRRTRSDRTLVVSPCTGIVAEPNVWRENTDHALPTLGCRFVLRAPIRINAVKQTLFTGLEATRTSDHKPVVAHFEIASSPLVKTVAPKQLSGAPLLQFRALKATGVRAADMNGKSDPFVVFFSNPPGLFGSRPPMTKVLAIPRATAVPALSHCATPALEGGCVNHQALLAFGFCFSCFCPFFSPKVRPAPSDPRRPPCPPQGEKRDAQRRVDSLGNSGAAPAG